ncbi:MAG TPA: hypothetical protein VGM67_12200 [Gemmatimonadaceae bacterium]|jgi:hypothetical protein
MALDANLDHIVFMKVGRHAGETFEQIIERKRREYDAAGCIFWGYGGGTMHPITRVQPFARMRVEHGERISIVMQEILSRHPDTEVFAQEYSRDGVHWEPIPQGVRVRGSRYALVLNEIQHGELDINLGEYQVGTGPSEGKDAETYIRGRVDKGCLTRVKVIENASPEDLTKVHFAAMLEEPYAVVLR